MESLGNVVIFGDSYSTFEGYIPEYYATHYVPRPVAYTDVIRVKETWWHQVMEQTGSRLVMNNSWSGSTIGYTGYGGADCSATNSFIHRLNKIIESNFFEENSIDTVLVFGGTNDSWCEASLGEMKFENIERNDLYSVLPAVCYFMEKLKSALPVGRILWLVNTDLKPEIENCILRACEHYGIEAITFPRIDKRSGHPTVKGMKDIADEVLKHLE